MNKSKLSVTIPEACWREGIPPGSVLIDGTDSVTPVRLLEIARSSLHPYTALIVEAYGGGESSFICLN